MIKEKSLSKKANLIRKRYRGSIFVNERGTYAIVDKEGNVVEKFRLKTTAINELSKIKELNMNNNYKIIKL